MGVIVRKNGEKFDATYTEDTFLTALTMIDGKYNTNGTLTKTTGEVITGNFVYGITTVAVLKQNGEEYTGELLSGKYHGKGRLKDSNGYYYEGIFKDGSFQ